MSTLADAINEEWKAAYGGEPVEREANLIRRVRGLADDRRCWLANVQATERENNRLWLLLELWRPAGVEIAEDYAI